MEKDYRTARCPECGAVNFYVVPDRPLTEQDNRSLTCHDCGRTWVPDELAPTAEPEGK